MSSWILEALNRPDPATSKYEIIILSDPIYQGKTFYMKFISKFLFGYACPDEVDYCAEFYDKNYKLIYEVDESEVEDLENIISYIDEFNEYFYKNIYDVFLDDNLNICKCINDLFNV